MPPTDQPIDVTDILAQPREFAQKLARVERERAELIETVSRLRAECNDAQAVARALADEWRKYSIDTRIDPPTRAAYGFCADELEAALLAAQAGGEQP